ncbi:hypothetical protein HOB25_02490 [bacterium]|jgi:uncharacterized membrane protein YraQ (UPF0718 family)|nr:hypothetical protein [bacterium]MBT7037453.1 hypothetical protein [bacterium]
MMKKALQKTIQTIKMAFPMILGVLLLISLMNVAFQGEYSKIFTGNYFLDPFIGAILGSFSFGIPITSYVAGGELLKEGVSLLAVTAFILAWTTVGVAMLPIEIRAFGKKFAVLRNLLNFISAIIIAVLTIATLKILS